MGKREEETLVNVDACNNEWRRMDLLRWQHLQHHQGMAFTVILRISLSILFPDGKNCKTCDRVVSLLETKKPELEEFGVRVVRIADRKLAKQNGVLNFPGLSFFKAGTKEAVNFEGDLSDGDAIVDFLASEEALDMPDRIEEVNAKHLEKLIGERLFMAVLFCKAFFSSIYSTHCLPLSFTPPKCFCRQRSGGEQGRPREPGKH